MFKKLLVSILAGLLIVGSISPATVAAQATSPRITSVRVAAHAGYTEVLWRVNDIPPGVYATTFLATNPTDWQSKQYQYSVSCSVQSGTGTVTCTVYGAPGYFSLYTGSLHNTGSGPFNYLAGNFKVHDYDYCGPTYIVAYFDSVPGSRVSQYIGNSGNCP